MDQLVAASVLGTLLGSKTAKIRTALILIAGWGFLFWSLATGDGGGVFAALLFLAIVFLAEPLLRSKRRNRGITVSDHSEGLEIESPQVKTIHKWESLGEARLIAGRLFVMIDGSCALVIPKRATTGENLDRLKATVSLRAQS